MWFIELWLLRWPLLRRRIADAEATRLTGLLWATPLPLLEGRLEGVYGSL